MQLVQWSFFHESRWRTGRMGNLGKGKSEEDVIVIEHACDDRHYVLRVTGDSKKSSNQFIFQSIISEFNYKKGATFRNVQFIFLNISIFARSYLFTEFD